MKRTHEFATLVEEISDHFHKGRLYFKESFRIVFVCGAKISEEESQRNSFMSRVANSVDSTYFLLAENALSKINGQRSFSHRNLADFEMVLGRVAHCVLIFIESAGAIAEIGYFSKSTELRKKILMVTKMNHQSPSFLNLGPMDLIERNSHFSPKFVFQDKLNPKDIETIISKIDLMKEFAQNYRKISAENWIQKAGGEQISILLKLVHLFRILTIDELKHIHKMIFGATPWRYLDELVGILESLDLVTSREIEGVQTLSLPDHTPLDVSCRGFDEDGFRFRTASTINNFDLLKANP